MAAPGEAEYVTTATRLGVGDPTGSLAIAREVCLFARMGATVFHSFIQTSIEPRFSTPGVGPELSKIMVAAGLSLCNDKLSVIQPEIQRLSGN
ncbi:MAG: hypothetical protein JWN46_91 [Acidimicrobiales bacterium]|nr:hypothetical protein [Acidimicrobiales bacterium]